MSQPDPTDSLGPYLRALRESRGGAIEEMARATRIGGSRLRALESEQFSELPAPVFIKGFIRAYCEFLGEKPDEALARYARMRGEPEAVPADRLALRSVNLRRRPWSASPIVTSLVLLVVFGASLLALNFWVNPGRKPAPRSAAVESTTTVAPPAPAPAVMPSQPVPARPVPSAPVPGPERVAGASQRLVVRAVEPTWVRVQTDDGRVVEELLQPGATREWTSAKRFVLTIGNAGGIELELNGRQVPRLGERGVVIRGLELPRGDGGS